MHLCPSRRATSARSAVTAFTTITTRTALAALTVLSAIAGPALADPYTIDYAGTVYQSFGPSSPGVGSIVSGRFTLDTLASAYVPDLSQPQSPDAGYYRLPVPPYGATVSSTTWSGVGVTLGAEVHDDDTVLTGTGVATDIIAFGSAVQGLRFLLVLFGNPASFSGNRPPDAAVVNRFWTSGQIFLDQQNSFGERAYARLDTLYVSAVPEAPALQLALPGLALLALAVHRRRSRARNGA